MTKKFLFLLLLIVSSHFCQAQFYKSFLPSPEFTNALEKIILDFRLNFETIKGGAVAQQEESQTYESTVKLPGAEECVINYYHSLADTTASWQAVMYRGENYNEASRTYQNVARLVKKSRVHWIDRTLVGFTGELQLPKEEVRFATTTLDFDLEDRRYEKFKAEVELVSTYSGYEVHLNLHTVKPANEGAKGY